MNDEEREEILASFKFMKQELEEISLAFSCLGAYLGGVITGAGLIDADEMAAEMERQAGRVGQEHAALTGRGSQPNKHLLGVANALLAIKGGHRGSFQVVQGGKHEPDGPEVA